MNEQKANDGFTGPLRYDIELIESLKKEVERLKIIYPVADVKIDLAHIMDKRWKTWKEYNGKEKQIP